MASAIAGIFNQAMAAGQAINGSAATPMANAAADSADAAGTSSSSTDSATISSNDFLTLLVTEMQNQDPTATTDPNVYINQLVNVNSLQQLIAINQTLSSAMGTPTTDTNGTATAQVSGASSTATPKPSGTTALASSAAPMRATAISPQTSSSGPVNLNGLATAAKHAPGNLSIPEASPSSGAVAHALDGQARSSQVPRNPAMSGLNAAHSTF